MHNNGPGMAPTHVVNCCRHIVAKLSWSTAIQLWNAQQMRDRFKDRGANWLHREEGAQAFWNAHDMELPTPCKVCGHTPFVSPDTALGYRLYCQCSWATGSGHDLDVVGDTLTLAAFKWNLAQASAKPNV